MATLKTHRISSDDETLYHSSEINIGNKKISTPIKTIDPKLITSTLDFNSSIKGIYEIYKVLNQDKIEAITTDTHRQLQFNQELIKLSNKVKSDEISLFFLEYETTNNKFPSNITLEYLADVCYGNSDLILPPLIKLKRADKEPYPYESYKHFLQSFYNNIEQLNNKPLGGVIPYIPYIFMRDLAQFYLNLGIHFFCFDFEGKNPLALKDNVRPFFRALAQEDSLADCSLYAINANPGKLGEITPAKDILSFGFGFDILGCNHRRRAIPPSLIKPDREPKVRLFNKGAYSYHSCTKNEVANVYSPDSSIQLENLKGDAKYLRFRKAYNIEQLGYETLQLQEIIGEEKLISYLDSKTHVKDADKKQIKKMRDDTKFIQKTL